MKVEFYCHDVNNSMSIRFLDSIIIAHRENHFENIYK